MLGKLVRRFIRDERGLTTMEWIGLAIVIIAVVSLAANALRDADGRPLANAIVEAISHMIGKLKQL